MAKTEWFIIGICISVLWLALVFESFFGFEPCELCIANRFPYSVILCLALVAQIKSLVVLPYHNIIKSLLYYVILLAIFAGFILTAYQVGIEYGWWREVAACMGGEVAQGMTIEEMMANLNKPSKACDDPDTILGFSLAELNFIPLLTLLALWIKRRVHG